MLGRTHGEGGLEIQRTSGKEHPQRDGQHKGQRVWRAECWGGARWGEQREQVGDRQAETLKG